MEYRIHKLDNQTWRIEEFDDMNSVYMYLLEGEEKALLIDTGFGMIPLERIVRQLTEKQIEVWLTHGHIDHIGRSNSFETVNINVKDKEVYQLHSTDFRKFYPIYQFKPQKQNALWFTGEQMLQLGNRTIWVIETPGHTLGSVCFVDKERKWLFTGDTCCKASVLLNLDYSATLETYQTSIDKLLGIKDYYNITWPAHHSVPVGIDILQQFQRALEMILKNGVEGEVENTPYGKAKNLRYQDISIVYK